MRKFLILYNAVFLVLGNILISDIHNLVSHNHHDDDGHNHVEAECEECLIFENTGNGIIDFEQSISSDDISELIVYVHSSNLESNDLEVYSPRAPPVS